MCEWCYKHGAGKKWYLNAKNYLSETAEEVGAQEYIFELWKQFEKVYLQRIFGISMKGPGYKFSIPLLGRAFRWYVNSWFRKEKPLKGRNPRRAEGHPGQVVTLEDSMKILELAEPILRVNCACRHMTRGIKDPCCLAFGALAEMVPKLPRYVPERGAEPLHIDEAKDFVDQMDKGGRVHTIWFGPMPYIAALCSCEMPECSAIRIRQDYNLQFLYKGEYVASVDFSKCDGCQSCVSRCSFGALSFTDSMNRPFINQWKCFGCGLCATSCPQDAISMVERTALESLREVW
ncbi:MAG: 4Fe-4S dicluster domain-containing protein [Candidatus Thorarchaeota archaeon]|nr:4Fe-4S dicluster domain-containing protein [Candidatus Thorarchaeota archaeon]